MVYQTELAGVLSELLKTFDEDAVQEVVTEFLERIAQGTPPPDNLRNYLFRACYLHGKQEDRDEYRYSPEKVPEEVDHRNPLDRVVAREGILNLPDELARSELQDDNPYRGRTLRRRRQQAREKFYGG